MLSDTRTILKQFKLIEQLYGEILAGVDDVYSDRVHKYYALCKSCINRVAGWTSSYAQAFDEEVKKEDLSDNQGRDGLPSHVRPLYGIVQALKTDVAGGYMTTLRESVRADLFSDFIETAEYFLSDGHKDAAAALVGGVLEEHLRQLCRKHKILLDLPNNKGVTKPKMGDRLNADIAAAGVYGLSEQKQVTAWQGIRNSAAHAEYGKYTDAEVKLFVQGLRDYIARHPA